MDNWAISIVVIVIFIGIMFYWSQTKFKNKMLCFFIRPNRLRIEKWVPLHNKEVTFGQKYGNIEQYICDPNCITMMWYARGFNKFFPILIPTLEFKWDTPNPINPKTFKSTWHTPAARQASWEEHSHIAFAKGVGQQAGRKSRIPEWFFPAITIIAILVVLVIVYQGMGGLDQRMFNLEQGLKLIGD